MLLAGFWHGNSLRVIGLRPSSGLPKYCNFLERSRAAQIAKGVERECCTLGKWPHYGRTWDFLRRTAVASWVRKVEVRKGEANFLKISLNLKEGTSSIDKGSVDFYPELGRWKENTRSFVHISGILFMTCGSEGTRSIGTTHST